MHRKTCSARAEEPLQRGGPKDEASVVRRTCSALGFFYNLKAQASSKRRAVQFPVPVQYRAEWPVQCPSPSVKARGVALRQGHFSTEPKGLFHTRARHYIGFAEGGARPLLKPEGLYHTRSQGPSQEPFGEASLLRRSTLYFFYKKN